MGRKKKPKISEDHKQAQQDLEELKANVRKKIVEGETLLPDSDSYELDARELQIRIAQLEAEIKVNEAEEDRVSKGEVGRKLKKKIKDLKDSVE